MTKLQQIRSEIKSILEDVSGIGKVYDYYRYSSDLSDVIKLFKSDKDYKGAMVRMISRSEDPNDESEEVKRKWEILLIRQVNDSEGTQKQIEELAELICETFNENTDLNGSVKEHNNLQLVGIDERDVSEILCHQAVLEIETLEEI